MPALIGWLTGGNDAANQVGLAWWCGAALFTLLAGLYMRLFPGVRVRRLFAPESPWVWRFFMGNFSLGYTLGWGVVGAGSLGAWCFAMGVWPPPDWSLGGGSLWMALVVPALLNAGRKTRLSRRASLALSGVVGGLGTFALWMVLHWVRLM